MSFYPIAAGKTTLTRFDPLFRDFEIDRGLDSEEAENSYPPAQLPAPACPKFLTLKDYDKFIDELTQKDPFFDEHRCGINWLPLRDPVHDTRFGHVYERQTILEWLKIKPTSPLNQEPMSVANLADSVELKKEIDRRLSDWIEKKNAQTLILYKEALSSYEKHLQEIERRDQVTGEEVLSEEEEPRNIPYGAGLAQLRSQQKIPTHMKVSNVAMGVLGFASQAWGPMKVQRHERQNGEEHKTGKEKTQEILAEMELNLERAKRAS